MAEQQRAAYVQGIIHIAATYIHLYIHDNVSYNNDQLVINMSDQEPQ